VNAVYADSAREYGMSELGTVPDPAKSSLTGLVDRSERHDLVQREPDPQDSGAARVAFTGRGGELTGDLHAGTCRAIEELASAERGTLAALLGRVTADNEVPTASMEPRPTH
jgi:DNA-binding MarR family transcriptional regulator